MEPEKSANVASRLINRTIIVLGLSTIILKIC